jgi:cytochrome d ubiquinol oxidase subunit II
MTVVAVIFTPIVLVYEAWTYWVFRRRISTHHIPGAVSPSDPLSHQS